MAAASLAARRQHSVIGSSTTAGSAAAARQRRWWRQQQQLASIAVVAAAAGSAVAGRWRQAARQRRTPPPHQINFPKGLICHQLAGSNAHGFVGQQHSWVHPLTLVAALAHLLCSARVGVGLLTRRLALYAPGPGTTLT